MKRLFLIYFFLGNVFILSAQDGTFSSNNVKFAPEDYDVKIIDTSEVYIYYDYRFIHNLEDKSINKTIALLEIGRKFSKFSDFHRRNYDSVLKGQQSKSVLGINDFNQFKDARIQIKFKKSVLKELVDEGFKINIQSRVYTKSYEYQEILPSFKWTIEEDEKKILNYSCKKASLEYRGRKWVAWFTKEIPLSNGPYIFGGLPGLIMEMYDAEKEHHFTITAIENKKNPIYQHIEKSILHVSRKQFLKAQRNFHENPEIFVGTLYKNIGSRDGMNLPSIPFNPIELD